MADESENSDDTEMAKLEEATSGVVEMISSDKRKGKKKKETVNDVPARKLEKILDETYKFLVMCNHVTPI